MIPHIKKMYVKWIIAKRFFFDYLKKVINFKRNRRFLNPKIKL